jgi:hypothetical protein
MRMQLALFYIYGNFKLTDGSSSNLPDPSATLSYFIQGCLLNRFGLMGPIGLT